MDSDPGIARRGMDPERSALPEARAYQGSGVPEVVPHILHVFPNFTVGGAQVRFVALADAFGAEYRHTVVSIKGGRDAETLLRPGAAVDVIGSPEPAQLLFGRLGQYRERIKAIRPDLLITYNWGSIEWAMANMFTGVPHLHIEDGFGPEEALRQLRRRVWARRLTLWRSGVVVPSSILKDLATTVWKLSPASVLYIPNGVEALESAATPLDAFAQGLPGDRPLIVWAGALRPEKNLPRLLRAFEPIKHQGVLIVVGDGPERGAIEAEIARLDLRSHVRLIGHRDDARDLIMQCDILALSSDTEQMPLTVLEGMDAGLPIASVDVGDVRNMVAPENLPFVVPTDESAMAEALSQLLANAPLRVSVGAANRVRARDRFAKHTMVDSYRSLFEATMGAPARGNGTGR